MRPSSEARPRDRSTSLDARGNTVTARLIVIDRGPESITLYGLDGILHPPHSRYRDRYQTLGSRFNHRGLDVQRFAESAFPARRSSSAVKQKRRTRARRDIQRDRRAALSPLPVLTRDKSSSRCSIMPATGTLQ